MAKTEATRAEMSAAKLPLAYRDQCAHLLIPLNKCRYDNYYLPWRCSVRFFPLLSHPPLSRKSHKNPKLSEAWIGDAVCSRRKKEEREEKKNRRKG